jgi:hypothetical protein
VQVWVQVNRPPSGGNGTIVPRKGIALKTNFALACEHWIDAENHYPLSYSFVAYRSGRYAYPCEAICHVGSASLIMQMAHRMIAVRLQDRTGSAGGRGAFESAEQFTSTGALVHPLLAVSLRRIY